MKREYTVWAERPAGSLKVSVCDIADRFTYKQAQRIAAHARTMPGYKGFKITVEAAEDFGREPGFLSQN